MKLQIAVLVIVVLAGFSFIGAIIFRSSRGESKALVILDTRSMTEAGSSVVDSTWGPTVHNIYLAGKRQGAGNVIPLADAFVCLSPNKSDSTKADTILLLDIQSQTSDKDAENPTKFWTGVRPAKKLNVCRVLIPDGMLKNFKTYKYKYGKVTLITDD